MPTTPTPGLLARKAGSQMGYSRSSDAASLLEAGKGALKKESSKPLSEACHKPTPFVAAALHRNGSGTLHMYRDMGIFFTLSEPPFFPLAPRPALWPRPSGARGWRAAEGRGEEDPDGGRRRGLAAASRAPPCWRQRRPRAASQLLR